MRNYCYEYEEEERVLWAFANLGDARFAECGAVSLDELEELKLPMRLKIERDREFEVGKYSLKEIMEQVKNG